MFAALTAGQIDAAMTDTAIVLGQAAESNGMLEVVGQYTTGETYGAIYPEGFAQRGDVRQDHPGAEGRRHAQRSWRRSISRRPGAPIRPRSPISSRDRCERRPAIAAGARVISGSGVGSPRARPGDAGRASDASAPAPAAQPDAARHRRGVVGLPRRRRQLGDAARRARRARDARGRRHRDRRYAWSCSASPPPLLLVPALRGLRAGAPSRRAAPTGDLIAARVAAAAVAQPRAGSPSASPAAQVAAAARRPVPHRQRSRGQPHLLPAAADRAAPSG